VPPGTYTFAGADKLCLRHFGGKPDRLEASLLPWLDQERDEVLMSNMVGYFRKIRATF